MSSRVSACSARAWILLTAILLFGLGCRVSLTPPDRRRWAEALGRWEEARLRYPGAPRPVATSEDVPVLLSLLNDYSTGTAAAVLLAAHPDLFEAALPHVRVAFRQSLEKRLDVRDWEVRSLRPVLTMRVAALRFFHDAGPLAITAVHDLETLLRARATRAEYAGGSGDFIVYVMAAVCREDPVPLIELLRDEDPAVRSIACRSLGALNTRESVAEVGPALAKLVTDESDGVVLGAANALATLRWSNSRIVDALTQRIKRAQVNRRPLTNVLASLKVIALESER